MAQLGYLKQVLDQEQEIRNVATCLLAALKDNYADGQVIGQKEVQREQQKKRWKTKHDTLGSFYGKFRYDLSQGKGLMDFEAITRGIVKPGCFARMQQMRQQE